MIIAVANQKGGVGKNHDHNQSGRSPGQQGVKTLVVDLDPQGNSSMSFLDVASAPEVDVRRADRGSQSIWTTSSRRRRRSSNLFIAPSTIALAKIESKLIGELDSQFRLKDELASVQHAYDYIIIDTPPTLGMITVNALVAASARAGPDPVQLLCAGRDGRSVGDDRQDQGPSRTRSSRSSAWSSPCTTSAPLLAKDIHEQIGRCSATKVFKTVITKSVRLEESPAYRESIFTFAPRSTGAYEYYRLSEEVLSRV